VRTSELAYRKSKEKLDGGVLDIVTLTQTQQTWFTAQDTLAQVRLARLLAIVSLYQALGGGWSTPAPPATATPAVLPAH